MDHALTTGGSGSDSVAKEERLAWYPYAGWRSLVARLVGLTTRQQSTSFAEFKRLSPSSQP
jgi:hypothetical protein